MSAIERAQALGAEHGRRDAEAWWPYVSERDDLLYAMESGDRQGLDWPEPAFAFNIYREVGARWTQEDAARDAYESAYREAVETTIRQRCS